MPRVPKPPELLQRRNKHTTKATLPSVEESAKNDVPDLPKREGIIPWHPRVAEWWRTVWKSPMAQEWMASDVSGVLVRAAELWQDFWMANEAAMRERLSKALSALETELGLTPIARRRLQWEVEKGDQAAERTTRRRQSRELSETSKKDPRDVLKVV